MIAFRILRFQFCTFVQWLQKLGFLLRSLNNTEINTHIILFSAPQGDVFSGTNMVCKFIWVSMHFFRMLRFQPVPYTLCIRVSNSKTWKFVLLRVLKLIRLVSYQRTLQYKVLRYKTIASSTKIKLQHYATMVKLENFSQINLRSAGEGCAPRCYQILSFHYSKAMVLHESEPWTLKDRHIREIHSTTSSSI